MKARIGFYVEVTMEGRDILDAKNYAAIALGLSENKRLEAATPSGATVSGRVAKFRVLHAHVENLG